MEKKDITKEYSNGDITIVWKPSLCMHSTNCWKGKDGLLSVFNPSKRPWIDPQGASTEEMVHQIKKCPSGALSMYYNDKGPESSIPQPDGVKVQVLANGPLLVQGEVTIQMEDGTIQTKDQSCALCRCGASANKPYCDGSHKNI